MGEKESKSARKPYLWLSLMVNLGILFVFKYWNFFGYSLSSLLSVNLELHNLLLPLGLSFYTLQTLSYIFDVYLGKIKPERHLGLFCLYVSFFPQLVAGPIERSRTLLPQLKSLELPTLYQFRYGLLLIVWGFFIKLVIADNLSASINSVYFGKEYFPFWVYWFIGALVTLKIYCDFMAYSEIARGVGMLFGVKLTLNFRRPLFATNLRSFWQRWHISLTRWIGDYIQIPLLRRYPTQPHRSVVTIMTLVIIGFWHSASWNFILFGLFHGMVMVIWSPIAKNISILFEGSFAFSSIFGRFFLAIVLMSSAPMFYIQDTSILFNILKNMLLFDLFEPTQISSIHGKVMLIKALFGFILLFLYSFFNEFKQQDFIVNLARSSSNRRWCEMLFIVFSTLFLGSFVHEPFIYFEF
ncbi:membrane bound O-acyl transferase MBOAT family protein [Shewanella woodyi ATCC 51908]|uniref:Probable alginate O-acetylase n=1 Tax=Shewanella woodyi (strain ATCC 51908 / MS32) TaxID=392500 RepID=B1KMG0_SHEWM|nr:membrane bound O-acyl transferase MBOAT family protein [Shewanella woodyi ATCC 51908]